MCIYLLYAWLEIKHPPGVRPEHVGIYRGQEDDPARCRDNRCGSTGNSGVEQVSKGSLQ